MKFNIIITFILIFYVYLFIYIKYKLHGNNYLPHCSSISRRGSLSIAVDCHKQNNYNYNIICMLLLMLAFG